MDNEELVKKLADELEPAVKDGLPHELLKPVLSGFNQGKITISRARLGSRYGNLLSAAKLTQLKCDVATMLEKRGLRVAV